ncbi:hypothetical protein SIAM614_22587 [Stappia aggregata IAM 12614]|uniref:Cytochrome c domain-containing protein n=1 Tax=Roseibium aggregatum (strain ATCC 25650 / DSM 13394 / JCM 20685 / NBRC 16684 / NCIMB 2208 / IAM 12614 / B1) TaxID=384765 RepID=A0NY73_ROSAI|nr:hypothetical protein SIAM614_22587 [Stappia aggregata IAM 12614] [Roseibium aggregatum IAM 12614]
MASNVREERVGCRALIVLAIALLSGILFHTPGIAQSRSFRLGVPDVIAETGFLQYLLPRFSLKTGIRIEIVGDTAPSELRLSEGASGRAVFSGLGKTWVLTTPDEPNEHAVRFRDWLTGDIGRRTVDAFEANGKQVFTAALKQDDDSGPVLLSGDAIRGEQLAVLHCGRCHMVNEATRLSTIGSSPSFAVMRSFTDWQMRFEAFFALNPHPAFTVIEGVTEPFDISRPSPIVPVEMTLEDLDAILAFVSRIPPADLGAPIQYQ